MLCAGPETEGELRLFDVDPSARQEKHTQTKEVPTRVSPPLPPPLMQAGRQECRYTDTLLSRCCRDLRCGWADSYA